MRVFIAGATGVLGRRLVTRLTDRGHDVVGLARDEAGERTVEERGGVPRHGDVLDASSLEGVIDDDVDVLVHAATAIPDSTKPSAEEWAYNDRIRVKGAKNLLAAAPDDLTQVLFPSVVWVARQPDGSQFDETAERHPDKGTNGAAETETLLLDRAETASFDAAILRCGFFYAPDARDIREFGQQLLDGDMPILGGGLLGRKDAELSFVHVDDAADAFVAAIENDASGIYHVVDDEPVAAATVIETLADLLDAPQPSRIPGWLARFFIGTVMTKGFTHPMPTTNGKAKRELDWEPTYPTVQEGLQQVVETWREDGTLASLRGESPDVTTPQQGETA